MMFRIILNYVLLFSICSSVGALTITSALNPRRDSCPANCTISFQAWPSYYWASITLTTTYTHTIILIIDEAHHTTRTSIKTVAIPPSVNLHHPLPTNAAGTVTHKIQLQSCSSCSTTLTYPTKFIDYPPGYPVQGTYNSSGTCLKGSYTQWKPSELALLTQPSAVIPEGGDMFGTLYTIDHNVGNWPSGFQESLVANSIPWQVCARQMVAPESAVQGALLLTTTSISTLKDTATPTPTPEPSPTPKPALTPTSTPNPTPESQQAIHPPQPVENTPSLALLQNTLSTPKPVQITSSLQAVQITSPSNPVQNTPSIGSVPNTPSPDPVQNVPSSLLAQITPSLQSVQTTFSSGTQQSSAAASVQIQLQSSDLSAARPPPPSLLSSNAAPVSSTSGLPIPLETSPQPLTLTAISGAIISTTSLVSATTPIVSTAAPNGSSASTKAFFPFTVTADVPYTPAPDGPEPWLSLTTLTGSESVTTGNTVIASGGTVAGSVSSSLSLPSSTNVLTTIGTAGTTSKGIGGYIWSGLGGGPESTSTSTPVSPLLNSGSSTLSSFDFAATPGPPLSSISTTLLSSSSPSTGLISSVLTSETSALISLNFPTISKSLNPSSLSPSSSLLSAPTNLTSLSSSLISASSSLSLSLSSLIESFINSTTTPSLHPSVSSRVFMNTNSLRHSNSTTSSRSRSSTTSISLSSGSVQGVRFTASRTASPALATGASARSMGALEMDRVWYYLVSAIILLL